MCRRIDCPKCGKPTFAGCGAHVEQVLGNVPPAERCQGHDEKAAGEQPGGDPRPRSWLGSLFGK